MRFQSSAYRRVRGAPTIALFGATIALIAGLFPALAMADDDHGPSVDTAHACRHFDDEAQEHTATTVPADAPVLQGTHRLFDVTMTTGDSGYVRYSVPEARTYAFFTGSAVQLSLSDASGAMIAPAGNSSTIEGCPAIAAWVAYEFAAAGTYTLHLQGVTAGEVLLLAEEASAHGHGHDHGDDDDHGHDDGHDGDHDHDHGDEHDHDTEVSDMAPWAGDWVSAGMFMSDSATNSLVSGIASDVSASPAAVRKVLEDMLETSFSSIAVTPTSIAFSGSSACSYAYTGETPASFNGSAFSWYTFETGDAACASYRYVLMTLAHGEGDAAHYHLRYGSSSPSAIANDTQRVGWYPSLYPSGMTAATFVQSMSGSGGELATFVSMMLGDQQPAPSAPAVGNAGLVATDGGQPGTAPMMLVLLATVMVAAGASTYGVRHVRARR